MSICIFRYVHPPTPPALSSSFSLSWLVHFLIHTHFQNKSEREWIANELESNVHDLQCSSEEKTRYWELLSRSERFDRFLASKFPNLKRYGLEGGESLLVALERIFEECGAHSIEDVVM